MKKAMKLVSLVLAVVMLLGCLAACSSKSATTDSTASTDTASTDTAASDSSEASSDGGEIVIALISNTTGDYAQYGQPVRDGAMLYINQLNANGGINGKQVKVLEYDDKGDGVEAVNAYNLACDNGITAVFGATLTGPTIALADATYEDNMPQVTASATASGVTMIDPDDPDSEIRQNVFRACFIDPYQGAAAAAYAYKTLGYKKAAVLTDVVSDYAVGISNFFKKSYKKLGGELVADMKYSSGDQDFTAQLTELISKKPDIVFMPAYFAEGAIIMKQARELGATFVLMGGDAMDNPDTVKIAGKAAEGFMQTAFPYDMTMKDMNDQAKAFTEAWKKNFPNKDPNVNATLGYTCYDMIIDALKRAGKADREAVTKALAETKGLATPVGIMTLNANHDAEIPVGILKYENWKRIYLVEIVPE